METVERIQQYIVAKKSYWPHAFWFIVGVLLSGWLVRDYYIDKFTLDEKEYSKLNKALFQENQDLISQLDIINDAHANAQQALDNYEKQLAKLYGDTEPVVCDDVIYIQPQACHFQEIPEELGKRINEAIVSFYH